MTSRWAHKLKNGSRRSLGYDARHVDAFLAHIGAGHAAGVDPQLLAVAIHHKTFPLVSKGYDKASVDEHLRALAARFSKVERTDAEVIAAYVAAA